MVVVLLRTRQCGFCICALVLRIEMIYTQSVRFITTSDQLPTRFSSGLMKSMWNLTCPANLDVFFIAWLQVGEPQ